jgi:hypothetical protein
VGWESRGKRTYYYRPVRIDGKPRKLYLGGGAVGEAHARQIARERRRREDERAAWRAEQTRLARAEAALDEVRGLVGLMAKASLLVAGWHDHRGEWRRRQ